MNLKKLQNKKFLIFICICIIIGGALSLLNSISQKKIEIPKVYADFKNQFIFVSDPQFYIKSVTFTFRYEKGIRDYFFCNNSSAKFINFIEIFKEKQTTFENEFGKSWNKIIINVQIEDKNNIKGSYCKILTNEIYSNNLIEIPLKH